MKEVDVWNDISRKLIVKFKLSLALPLPAVKLSVAQLYRYNSLDHYDDSSILPTVVQKEKNTLWPVESFRK